MVRVVVRSRHSVDHEGFGMTAARTLHKINENVEEATEIILVLFFGPLWTLGSLGNFGT